MNIQHANSAYASHELTDTGPSFAGTVGFIILCLFAIAAIGLGFMALVQQEMTAAGKFSDAQAELALTMRSSVSDRADASRTLATVTDAAEKQAAMLRIKTHTEKYTGAEEVLNKLLAQPQNLNVEAQDMLLKVKQEEYVAQPLMTSADNLGMLNHNSEATNLLIKVVQPFQTRWVENLTGLIAIEKSQKEEIVALSQQSYSQACTAIAILSIAVALISIASAYLIRRCLRA
jgi:hypothetical protein